MKNCNHCGLYLPDEAFNWRNRLLGIRHVTCRNCQKEYQQKWYEGHKDTHLANVQSRKVEARQEARQFVLEYLYSHPCSKCGETDPIVLEFDHIRGKEEEIARLITNGASIDRLEKEMRRCQVLCSNCHRRKTAKEQGWFRGKL